MVIILTVCRGTGVHLPEQSVKKAGGLSSGKLLFYLQVVVMCECPTIPVVLKDQTNIFWDNELKVDVPNLACLSVVTLHCYIHLWVHTK